MENIQSPGRTTFKIAWSDSLCINSGLVSSLLAASGPEKGESKRLETSAMQELDILLSRSEASGHTTAAQTFWLCPLEDWLEEKIELDERGTSNNDPQKWSEGPTDHLCCPPRLVKTQPVWPPPDKPGQTPLLLGIPPLRG